MKNLLRSLPLLLLLSSGCISVDYVGQSFAALPESVPVKVYDNRKQLEPGKYGIVGRITLTAKDGTDGWDIRDRLIEEARSHGAEAVCVVSARKIKIGTYEISNSEQPGISDPNVNIANLNEAGAPLELNSFDQRVRIGGEMRARFEWQFKALLLMDKAKLQKLLKERSEELSALESADPAADKAEEN